MKKKMGILDSGIGGLTFVNAIIQKNLSLDLVYISDAQYVPYGNKQQSFMKQRIEKMMHALQAQHVGAVFMACNTATAETIDEVRKQFVMPVIGIEPYMRHRHAGTCGANRKYALILTPATMRSARFAKLQKENDPCAKIDVYGLEHLAILIESLKDVELAEIESKLQDELSPLVGKQYSHIILGCTHYAIIANWIANYLHVEIVDPTPNIINHIASELAVDDSGCGSSFFYSENCGNDWRVKEISAFGFLSERK